MSYFSKELESIMQEKKISSAAELSRISGVDQATLSRVRYGEQQISHSDLDALAKAIDGSAQIHARMLRARLSEDLRPPGGDLIDIDIRGNVPPLKESRGPDYVVALPAPLEKAMRSIASNVVGDQALKEIVIGLGKICEKGSLS